MSIFEYNARLHEETLKKDNVINLTAKPKRGMNLGVMQVHSSLRFPLAENV